MPSALQPPQRAEGERGACEAVRVGSEPRAGKGCRRGRRCRWMATITIRVRIRVRLMQVAGHGHDRHHWGVPCLPAFRDGSCGGAPHSCSPPPAADEISKAELKEMFHSISSRLQAIEAHNGLVTTNPLTTSNGSVHGVYALEPSDVEKLQVSQEAPPPHSFLRPLGCSSPFA